MGKASSAKKVARAARAGGSSRSGQRRNLGFPATIALVIVLGVALVLVARNDQQASAEPVANQDHWHAAYGLYHCDQFLPPITDQTDTVGIHTHGDGVIHIHPFVSGAAGTNAKLSVFEDAVGLQITEDELVIPGGETYKKGDKCGDEPGIIQVARWANADDATAGEQPTEIITEDFGDIRFRADREALTIAFAPEGADIPPPESIPTLDQLSDVGTPPSSDTSVPSSDTSVPSSDTSVPSSDTSTPPGSDTTSTSTATPTSSSTSTSGP
jgi:hypothetical protein